MNLDFVLLITDSIENFFNENFNLALKRKEIELHESFSNIDDGIFLNLIGGVEGKIVLTYTDQFRNYLSEMLVEGVEENGCDEELRVAALKEFLNQLSGHIVTKMEDSGYDWDIEVPHFIENGEPKLDSINLETVVIPYFNDNIGDMKIKIALCELKS